MKVTIKLTNHKNPFWKQILKVVEECFEVVKAIIFRSNAECVIDELIDVSKVSLKAAKTLSDKKNISFEGALKKNHAKNKCRGYHDED